MHSTTRVVAACGLIATLGATLGASFCVSAQTGRPPRDRPDLDRPTQRLSLPARLVLKTDAACDAKVGDRPVEPVLLPGEPRTMAVGSGETSVECTSTVLRDAVVKRTVTVAAGGTVEVAFDVGALVVKAQCSGKAATLAVLGGGLLRHCVTGLDWTQSDSGPGGLFFEGAVQYCAAKGNGWEIPMPDELAELIDRTGKSQTPCGVHTCNVSPHFKFTSPIFWSNEKTHEGMHMIVNLILGGRHPTADDANFDYHTLCVRRVSRP